MCGTQRCGCISQATYLTCGVLPFSEHRTLGTQLPWRPIGNAAHIMWQACRWKHPAQCLSTADTGQLSTPRHFPRYNLHKTRHLHCALESLPVKAPLQPPRDWGMAALVSSFLDSVLHLMLFIFPILSSWLALEHPSVLSVQNPGCKSSLKT